MNETSKTSFGSMLREYGGVLRIVLSGDFVLAGVIGITLGLTVHYSSFEKFLPHMLSTSAVLLSVVVASIAILAAVSESKLIAELHKHNLLRRLLFPFWLVAGAIVLAITIECSTMLLGSSQAMELILSSKSWRCISLLVFLYGLFGVVYLVPSVIRFIVFRAIVDRSDEEDRRE